MIPTGGAQQQRSGPQTPEQLAVTAVGFHVELVRVVGLTDPLRLLHPDGKRRSSGICLLCLLQDKIYSHAYHVMPCVCVCARLCFSLFTCQRSPVHSSGREDRKTVPAKSFVAITQDTVTSSLKRSPTAHHSRAPQHHPPST